MAEWLLGKAQSPIPGQGWMVIGEVITWQGLASWKMLFTMSLAR